MLYQRVPGKYGVNGGFETNTPAAALTAWVSGMAIDWPRVL
jgi:hypothetical protein